MTGLGRVTASTAASGRYRDVSALAARAGVVGIQATQPARAVQPARETFREATSDPRRAAATPSAALLAELIHRMGGAPSSLARGAYVSVRA